MDLLKGWITCKDVMGYLNVNEFELAVLVHNSQITAYDKKLLSIRSFYVTPDSIYDMLFKYDEVEKIKKKNHGKLPRKEIKGPIEEDQLASSEPLIGEEVIDLKTIINDESYLDEAIPAAVAAGIFIAKQKFPVSKKILYKILANEGVDNITDKIFKKIWKAIPADFKNESKE